MSGGPERELDALYLLARSHASFSSPDRILFLLSQLLHPCLPIHSSSDELAVLYCEENGAPLRGLADFTAWSDVASLTKEAPRAEEVPEENEEGGTDLRPMESAGAEMRLSPHAALHVFYAEYHLVFTLDLSPSIFAVDPTSGVLLLEQQAAAVEACFEALTGVEMQLGNVLLRPRLLVSVLLIHGRRLLRVPLQAALLSPATYASLIASIRKDLLALQAQQVGAQATLVTSPSTSAASSSSSSSSSVPASAPPELADSLGFAAQAARLGPSDACPIIVLLTDGTAAPLDHTLYDGPLMRITREALPCFVLRLGGAAPSYPPLAFFADTKALRYVALATDARPLDAAELLRRASAPFGSPPVAAVDDDAYSSALGSNLGLAVHMSFTQRLLLVRTLQAQAGTDRSVLGAAWQSEERAEGWHAEWVVADESTSVPPIDHAFPWRGAPPPVALLRTLLPAPTEPLPVEITGIAALRTREGFKLAEVLQQGSAPTDSLLMRFVLPWQPHVHIEYSIRTSSASLNATAPSRAPLTIELALLALADFSALFLAGLSPDASAKSSASKAHAYAAQQAAALATFIGALNKTDRLLGMLVAHKSAVANTAPSTENVSALWGTVSYAAGGLQRWFRPARFDVLLRHDPLPVGTQLSAGGATYTEATAQITAAIERWASHSAPQSRMFVRVLEATSSGAWKGAGRAGLVLLRIAWPARNLLSIQLFFIAVAPPRRRAELAALKQSLASLVAPTAPPRLPPRSISVPTLLPAIAAQAAASSSSSSDHPAPEQALALAPLAWVCDKNLASLLVRIEVGEGSASSSAQESGVAEEAELLQAYARHSKRNWQVGGASGEMLLQFVMQTRLAEGWLYVALPNSSSTPNTPIHAFYRELPLRLGPSQSVVSAAAFYTVRLSAERLVTDLWLEPQTGIAAGSSTATLTAARDDTFAALLKLVHGADARLAAALTALDALAAALAVPRTAAPSPRVALAPLLARAIAQREAFAALTDPEAAPVNTALAAQLEGSLSAAADIEVQVSDEDGAALVPLPVNASAPISWLCFAKRGDDDRLLLALSPKGGLGLHVWEVSRKEWCAGAVAPDPALQALLGTPLPSVRSSSSAPPATTTGNATAVNAAPAAVLSLQLRAFVAGAREAYSRAYARAVYTHLRRGGTVSSAELKAAQNECREVVIVEQELSSFQALLSRHSIAPEPNAPDHLAEAQRRLALAFVPWVPFPTPTTTSTPASSSSSATSSPFPSSSPTIPYFFYCPPAPLPSLAPDAPPADDAPPPPQPVPDLSQDSGLFANALFLRAEQSVLASPGAAVQTTNVDPRSVGTPALSSRATLRLYFSSLPPDSAPRARPALIASTSGSSSGSNAAAVLNAGGRRETAAIVGATKERLQEVVHAEVLDSLRFTRPVTKATLTNVLSLLNALPASSLATLTLSLSFFDMKEGRRQFPSLLHRTPQLSLVRYGDVYYAIEPNTTPVLPPPLALSPAAATSSNPLSLSSSSNASVPPLLSQMSTTSMGSGASIMGNSTNLLTTSTSSVATAASTEAGSSEANTGDGELAGASTYSIPYWLILTHQPQEDTVTALFYSYSLDPKERSVIFRQVTAAVTSICEHINRLCLLSQLHDTRLASDLLIPRDDMPEAQDSTSAPPSATASANAANSTTAGGAASAGAMGGESKAGQYACECQATVVMPFSRRVSASSAMRAVAGATLHPFLVSNRRHTYVYRELSGNVFYLRLSADEATPTTPGSLTVKVHGLTRPSPEISVQLVALLESKLVQITVALLSTALLRNPLLRLTDEDIDFIRPPHSVPARTFSLALPEAVSTAWLFAALARQNLLTFLNPLHRAAVTGDDDSAQSLFVYNYLQEGPQPASSLYTHIGQGIALIELTVTNPVPSRTPSPEPSSSSSSSVPVPALRAPRLEFRKLRSLADWASVCASPPPALTSPSAAAPEERVLTVSVWVRGGLNTDALQDVLATRMHQVLCDYALETAFFAPSPTAPEVYVRPAKTVLKKGLALGSPSIVHCKFAWALPAWELPSLLAELHTILSELNPRLSPSIHFTPDRKHPQMVWLPAEPSGAVSLLTNGSNGSFLFVGGKLVAAPAPGAEADSYSRTEAMCYGHIRTPQPFYRASTVLLFVRARKCTALAYNLSPAVWEQLQVMLTRLASWKGLRAHLLSTLVHYKAGLPLHLPAATLSEALPMPTASPVAPHRSAPASSSSTSSSSSSAAAASVRYTLDTMELLLNPSPARGKGAAAAAAALQSGNSGSVTGGGANAVKAGTGKAGAAKPSAAAIKNAPALADVLRSHVPSVPLHWTTHSSAPEPLVRHALHLKQVYTEETARLRQRATQRQLHWQIWGAGKTAAPPAGYVRALLSQAQLIDVCRAPHGFHLLATPEDASSSSARRLPEVVFGSEGTLKDGQIAYSAASSAAFAADYAAYVQQAHGASQLSMPENEGGATRRLLLQRAWPSGAAVLEVAFRHEHHLSVALYALDRALLTGKEADGRAFAGFLEEVLRLKAALHTQSFVYDAALRFAAVYLAAPTRQLSPVDCVRAMQGLTRAYPHAPRYARNSLLWGGVRVELSPAEELLTAVPFDVFSAAAANAEVYGWRNLDQYGLTPGMLLSSLPLPASHSPYVYHLLALFSPPALSAAPHLHVSFLALIVSSATHPLSSTEHGEAEARAARDAWVDTDARARLTRALNAAVADFQRDVLWRRVCSPTRPSLLSADQLRVITSLAFGRDVCLLDARLASLFGATPALLPHLVQPLFLHLAKLNGERTCFVLREAQPYYRLVFLCRPGTVRTLLFDLQLFPNGCLRLTLFARTHNELTAASYERNEVVTLTNKICAFVWRDTLAPR